MIDASGRKIDYLRISLTDRCNLRCVYCMPEQGVTQCSHTDILTYEEILRTVRVMTTLGVRHIRLTGGEPMARRGCLEFIRSLRAIPEIETISMTTNATLLDGRMREAAECGLNAVNISMDTTDGELFRRITRGGDLEKVLRVLDDALELGLRVKLNAVPIRGWNEQEIVKLAEIARAKPVCVRFIELMPIGCGADLGPIPSDEILSILAGAFGTLNEDHEKHGFGPARYVKPEGFCGSLGVISPISHEFCDRCNRVRLTSGGFLKLCLNHRDGLDVRELLRNGTDDDDLRRALEEAIARKPRRHGFGEEIADREQHRMNEIGG